MLPGPLCTSVQSISRPRLNPVRTRWLPRSPSASLQPTPHPTLPPTAVDARPPSKAPARRVPSALAGSPPLPVEPRPLQTASLLVLPLLWRWQNRPGPPEPQRRQACRQAACSARGSLGAGRQPVVGLHALELPIPSCRGRIEGDLYSPFPIQSCSFLVQYGSLFVVSLEQVLCAYADQGGREQRLVV